MLSEQSKQGLASVFERSARSTIVRSPNDVCQITVEPADGTAGPTVDPSLVITIASFALRLLVIFHLNDSDANRAYFVPEGLGGGTLQESFAEVANLCCGALNREIGSVLRHLAMSIPSSLSAQCLESLPDLNPEYTARFAVSINNTVRVGVTLCMCCTAPVDIPLILAGAEPEAGGTLELF